jgi:hypothetical protein
MIQIKNKKVIIVIVISLLILSAIILFWLFKTTKVDKVENNNMINNITATSQKRLMTDSEKEIVGIPKNQKAEVLNDETGFFIYNVIK